jgi:hypothetical protein
MCILIWRNHWDARAAEAMARISIQDSDAKVAHTPPNERDGMYEGGLIEEEDEEAIEDEMAEPVTGTSGKTLV